MLSVPLMLIALPICLCVSVLILLDSGRPVIFRQERVGLHQAPFTLLKFRTMPQDTPQVAKDQAQNYRITIRPLGVFLRRFSLDEIPQLWNVVRGDMSLVGPRPALSSQVELIEMRDVVGVYSAKPGVTGLSQVSGRESLSLESKVQLDREYVQKASLSLDLQILIRTAFAIFSSRGTY